MSKYQKLWEYINKQNKDQLLLDFAMIEKILGFPIDHGFLNSKKELLDYGYCVYKVSLKEKTIKINRAIK